MTGRGLGVLWIGNCSIYGKIWLKMDINGAVMGQDGAVMGQDGAVMGQDGAVSGVGVGAQMGGARQDDGGGCAGGRNR